MKTLTITADPQNQFSAFLMDHLKPITMRQHWDLSLRINYYIKPLIQTLKFITDLGEAEHSGDWDPSIKITFWNDNQILKSLETEPGYYNMIIQGTDLLLEKGYKQHQSHNIIPISQIHSIRIIRN